MHPPRPGLFRLALATRAALLVWGVVLDALLPDHDPGADVARFATGLPAGSTLGALAQPWTRWDGAHFLTLARDGYVESAAAAAVGCYCYP
jgi:hypothetical protein